MTCVDPDPCCTDLSSIAYHLLTSLHEAISSCYPEECLVPTPYLTMGQGDDGVGSSLTVAVASAVPTTASSPNGTLIRLPMVNAVFTVRLLEAGWPTVAVVGSDIRPPDPVDQNRFALQVFGRGERLYRKLLHMNATHQMLPDEVKGCGAASISQLVPIPPRGGVVGWSTSVTIPVRWGGG